MKRQPRKRLIRDRSYPLIKAAGLSAAALAERAGYSLRQTLYALDGRRTCPERVADVLCATLGPDGWRFLCGEADSVTLTRTFQAGAERAAADGSVLVQRQKAVGALVVKQAQRKKVAPT